MVDGLQLPIKPENSGRCTSGFCTPKQDKNPQTMLVTPKRVLPIIFIPGIMGSNLRMSAERQTLLSKNNNLAWRVDSKRETLKFADLPPAQRQLQLDPATTSVDSYDTEHSETGDRTETTVDRNSSIRNIPYLYDINFEVDPNVLLCSDPDGVKGAKSKEEKALERGWGEILWGSYGTLLQLLEQHLNNPFSGGQEPSLWWRNQILNIDPKVWGAMPNKPQKPLTPDDLKRSLSACWFPVHSIGYNWLNSNKSSAIYIANRIESIMKKYISMGYQCEKVILISHSMGGLVARATMHPKIGNLQENVLGVVHGAMPAIGAGTAYKRIKCGFEGASLSITINILGKTGQEVTAVLGNSQGGMELLPTKSYGNSWLTVRYNEETVFTLPINGDPFTEIYKAEGCWYRLLNPDWINPASLQKRGIIESFKLLDSAKNFHEVIDKYYHPNSFSIYGADSHRLAWGSVIWRLNKAISPKKFNELTVVSDDAKGSIEFSVPDLSSESNTAKKAKEPITSVMQLATAADAGDETVPIRSADDQLPHCKAVFRQVGYEHQGSFKDTKALSATFYSLIRIIETMKWTSG